MKCLVTGANGFVGSAIVRRLLARGESVVALVRPASDMGNLEGLAIDVRHGDLLDPNSLAAAVQGCSHLIHAAADYRLWTKNPHQMYRTNIEGTLNMLAAAGAAGVERIVYTSSVAVLGTNPDGSPADEETPVDVSAMVGHYKRSKFLAEQAVRERMAAERWPVVIVNPSTPIGPGDIKPTPTGRIIVDAATGKIPAFVDTGLNIVHVDDVADGHLQAMAHGRIGERYVLGGTDMSLQEILQEVALQCGRKPPTVRLPRLAVYPVALVSECIAAFTGREPRATLDGLRMAAKHMYFSSAKAEAELGYHARRPQAAIGEALQWFREHAYI